MRPTFGQLVVSLRECSHCRWIAAHVLGGTQGQKLAHLDRHVSDHVNAGRFDDEGSEEDGWEEDDT